jgi:membrane-bound ClpP family serine protease
MVSPASCAEPLAQEDWKMLHHIRLDYVSCVLTILGTILLGRKLWQGWVVAAVNSAVVCVIGLRTAQFGFVPANLLCIALYAGNLFHWCFKSQKN